ncbi:anaphase-promoting complex [Sarcoptes scabiei]|nr:anaphase-promoting complex [Sarcoptes scabiei]
MMLMVRSLPVRQFGILLWKSYIIRKRHYIWTLLELFLPVFIASLSIIAHSDGKGGSWIEEPIRYRPVPIDKSLHSYYTLLYTPVNEFTMNLMSRVSEKVECRGVESPEELDEIIKSEIPFTISDSVEKLLLGLQENETIAGVIFHFDDEFSENPGLTIDIGNETLVPQNFRYTLRVRDFELQSDPYPKKQDFAPFVNADHYIKKNFIAVQALVNYAYLQMLSEYLYPNGTDIPFPIPEIRDIRAQRFPYPKYIRHPRFQVSIISRFFPGASKLNTIQLTMEYCTILGYVVMIVLLIKGIVDEKVNRARAMLRLMGLKDFIYYSSCFANTFMVMIMQAIILTCIFCSGSEAQLKGASFSLVLSLLLLYSASSIMFAMAIAIFFKKPTNAMIIGFIMWLSVQEVVGMLFEKRAGLTETSGLIHIPEWAHLIICAFVPNYALKVSNELLVESEVYAAYGTFVPQYSIYSAHWSNIFNVLPLYKWLSVLRIAGAMAFSCVFYGFVVWYFDVYRAYKQQSNERYGGYDDDGYDNPAYEDSEPEENKAKYFEAEPKKLRVGIQANELRKEFAVKVAVKNVTLNVYHGQITVLLGHNGAGKTTFASMLTGLYQPTSGELKVDGVDAIKNPEFARRRMGLCPQFDVLYDELTCEEHLRLFAVVKNCPPKRVSMEVSHVLDQLGLSFKRRVLSKDLSGGMKRRLSLGMAMINNTKILILDEPTSGLDPEARRGVWDFLLSIRKERLIMLSTHWMEEADVLGDRIAIMSRGRVICCGSSIFLKRVYAGGYHLRIAKSDKFDSKYFQNFVRQNLPESKLENETGNEIKFTIAPEDTSRLPNFFEKLENEKQELGVYSCGVNVSSMDDVFLKVIELENTKSKSLEAAEASMNHDLQTLAVVRTSRANSVISIYQTDSNKANNEGTVAPPTFKTTNNHLDVFNNNVLSVPYCNPSLNEVKSRKLKKLPPGQVLMMLKLKALLAKRVHDIKRNTKTVVPILGIAIGCIFAILGLIETTVNTTDRFPNWSMDINTQAAGYSQEGLRAIYFDYEKNNNLSFRSYYLREIQRDHYKPIYLDDSRTLAQFFGHKNSQYNRRRGSYVDKTPPPSTAPVRNYSQANDRLLDMSLKDLNSYREKWLVGASTEFFRKRQLYLAWYNGEAPHSLPISINMLYNALLKKLVAKAQTPNGLPINAENFSITLDQITFEHFNPHSAFLPFFGRVYNGIFFPFSVSFIAAFYVLFPTHERISKAKLLQLMTGLSVRLYWISNFVFDFTIYFCYFVAMFTLILIWDRSFGYGLYFSNPLSTVAFILLFLTFGLAAIPFAYVASLIFKKPSTAFGILCLISVITGIGMGVIATFFETMLEEKLSVELRGLFYTMMWFTRLSPVVSLILGAQKLFTLDSTRLVCAKFQQSLRAILCGIYAASQRTNPELEELKILKPERCCDEVCGNECIFQHPFFWFNWLGVNDEIFMLLFDTFLYWCLLALLDNKRIRELISRKLRTFYHGTKDVLTVSRSTKSFKLERMGHGQSFTDKDVLEERARTEKILAAKKMDQEALCVHNLTKIYPNGNFKAVDQLCFAVSKEQFFGLLGINGAGKTTTFRMLTGDLSTTRGNSWAGGSDLLSSTREYQSQIGYCPQFDALLDRLNSFETLQLYGRLRGIPDDVIKLEVNRLIKKVDLQAHADRMCRNYSGGNKRKLSLAMALIGAPPVVLLDEPTSGVDPVARRKMWVAISDIQYGSGSSIILSSHSMDECEALCDRIAIMASGHFECIGSTQYLRTKFGQGYSLIIKLNPDIVAENDLYLDQVQQSIEDRLPSAVLRDIHQTLLFYHIPPESDVTWASLFRAMEEAKSNLQLEDYQVGDTTLEQIFLSFAKKRPQERPKRKSLADIAEIL